MTHYEPRKEKWLMTQRTFPGMEDFALQEALVKAESLDYGAFMRSTTPQERVEAITGFLSIFGLTMGEFTAFDLEHIFKWLVEAAGPQGYEVVPLDWIRKLRQSKAGPDAR